MVHLVAVLGQFLSGQRWAKAVEYLARYCKESACHVYHEVNCEGFRLPVDVDVDDSLGGSELPIHKELGLSALDFATPVERTATL